MSIIRNYEATLCGQRHQPWKDWLIATHLAVNSGAQCFLDHLVTLRGGISPKLGYSEDPVDRAFRRQILCRCWLSPELLEDPSAYVVLSSGSDPYEMLVSVTKTRFLEILVKSGESDLDGWERDCFPTLFSPIRAEAYLVDRSTMYETRYGRFDVAADAIENEMNRWLGANGLFGTKGDVDKSASGQIAVSFLSTHWGSGKKSDGGAIAENCLIASKIILESMPGTLPHVLGERLLSALSYEKPDGETTEVAISRAIGWVRGRASSGKLRLNEVFACEEGIPEGTLAAVAEALRAEGEKKGATAVAAKLPESLLASLRIELESAIGVPYRHSGDDETRPRDQQVEYSSILAVAAAKFSGNHSFLKNQTIERLSSARAGERVKEFPDSVQTAFRELLTHLSLLFPGNEDAYSISKREIRTWREVVESWADTPNAAARAAKVSTIQTESGRRTGHSRLFSILAEDRFLPLWKTEEGVDDGILPALVEANASGRSSSRRKSPSLRHFDPAKHPAYAEFGIGKIPAKISRPVMSGSGEFEISLVIDGAFRKRLLRWRSARMAKELFPERAEGETTIVPKADRIGRAAAGEFRDGAVSVTGVDDVNKWAGLIIPEKAKVGSAPAERIRWRLMAAAKLEPRGPWTEYCAGHNLRADPHYERNKAEGRSPAARLKLCHLPGLRVMGVWPTHSKGVFCSVWRTLGSEEASELCRFAGVEPPGPDDFRMAIRSFGKRGNPKTVLLRRVAADLSSNGEPNPVSWAILEESYTIRLKGENDNYVRKASFEELEKCRAILAGIGVNRRVESLPKNILSLSWFCTINAGRLLERHRRAAIIARDLAESAVCEEAGKRDVLVARALANWANGTAAVLMPDETAKTFWANLIAKTGLIPPDQGESDAESRRRSFRGTDFLDQVGKIDRETAESFSVSWRHVWEEEDGFVKDSVSALCRLALGDVGNGIRRNARRTRGYSLSGILLLREILGLKKSFRCRFRPNGDRETVPPSFCSKLSSAIRAIQREKRKETAAHIAAAAVGIGHERKQCQCVVLPYEMPESPMAGRTENRIRRVASVAELLDTVASELELFGIKVWRSGVFAATRKSFATGAFMARCKKISAEKVFDLYERTLASITSRLKREVPVSDLDSVLVEIVEKCVDGKIKGEVLLPDPSGPLLAGENGERANYASNAAANLAISVLLDPDWLPSWDNVPCDAGNRPDPKFIAGSRAFDGSPLAPKSKAEPKIRKKGRSSEKNTLWRTSNGIWLPFGETTKMAEKKIANHLRSDDSKR